MDSFEKRWQSMAARAREARDPINATQTIPSTARILARSRAVATDGWMDLLLAMTPRAAVAAAFVCALSAAYAALHNYESRLHRPSLEQTLLRELPWP